MIVIEFISWSVWCTKHLRNIFHAHVGLVQVPQEARWDTLRQTCAFVFDAIHR
jgi:hypothetical protein